VVVTQLHVSLLMTWVINTTVDRAVMVCVTGHQVRVAISLEFGLGPHLGLVLCVTNLICVKGAYLLTIGDGSGLVARTAVMAAPRNLNGSTLPEKLRVGKCSPKLLKTGGLGS
jgi:hypothetical protein